MIAFSTRIPGLADCRIVLERNTLPTPGGIEHAFTAGASAIRLHRGDPAEALIDAAGHPGTRWVVAIRNPDLVLDDALGTRLAAARDRLEGLDAPVAIAAAGGLSFSDGTVSRLYSARSPALPAETRVLPLVDPAPDLWIADAGFLKQIVATSRLPACGFETALAVAGWQRDRLSLYLPELSGGIDGSFLTRDDRAFNDGLSRCLPSLTGNVTLRTIIGEVKIGEGGLALENKIGSAILAASPTLSLSLVVRTRFDRPHLLDRLLTTISRARPEDVDLEVIISTDADTASDDFSAVARHHPYLSLRLQRNAVGQHSRVENLLGGLRAARKRHVAVIDDDDYVDLFAFEQMARAGFMGAETLMFAPSPVHDETWETTPSGRNVLARSAPRASYPADGWRRIWDGTNTLPICAFVAPRSWLINRLPAFSFDHDLSEDYALLLLMLTDPDLPPIHELAEPFVHISLRGTTENATLMEDRRRWTADISAHLAALTTDRHVAGAGVWRLMIAGASASPADNGPDLSSQGEETVARLRRELGLLRADRDRLRRIAAEALGRVSVRSSKPTRVCSVISEPEPA